jgi:hypothetical protein
MTVAHHHFVVTMALNLDSYCPIGGEDRQGEYCYAYDDCEESDEYGGRLSPTAFGGLVCGEVVRLSMLRHLLALFYSYGESGSEFLDCFLYC